MRNLIVGAAATALLLPAGVAGAKATPAHGSANRACQQQRHDLGVATFRLTYGTNHNRANAMGKCRSAERRAHAKDRINAATTCQAERASDPVAFRAKYGTGKKGRNALGKCISEMARAAADARHAKTEHAARDCRSKRADDAAAFRARYGTNKRKRNAFGHCVRTSYDHAG